MLKDTTIYLTPHLFFIFGFIYTTHTVDVRLIEGPSENQGRVEVREHAQDRWGRVCDLKFAQEEAMVVCRQLNYKYGRNERNVYEARFPNFRLENVDCTGNESTIDDCIHGEWKTGTGDCDAKSHDYASVCCSNSPEFGEFRDNMFVSHCADNWTMAEETCERKQANLISSDEYKNILGSFEHVTEEDVEKSFWTKQFFTPWIWSNGCYKFKDINYGQKEFNLENNTAFTCLQLCSTLSKPSLFLVSNNLCRCLSAESMNSYLTEVEPGSCNVRCHGNSFFQCGSDTNEYWNLYSIVPNDMFYKVTDPEMYEIRQCAVLTEFKKLSTEDCSKNFGHICTHVFVEENATRKLIVFKDSAFYKMPMLDARKRCWGNNAALRLAASEALYLEVFTDIANLWVDVFRELTSVYTIDWDSNSYSMDSNLWHNLKPDWCQATRIRQQHYSNEIAPCGDRLRYICSMYREPDESTDSSHSSSTSTDSGTGHSDHNSKAPDPGGTTTPVYVDRVTADNSRFTTVAIAASVGAFLVFVIIVSVYFLSRSAIWKRLFCCKFADKSQPKIMRGAEYSVSYHGNDTSPEHVYSEIKDPDNNVYNEIDELLQREDNSCVTNDTESSPEKEPVTIKRSYSSPKDLTELDAENSEKTNTKYVYPYDMCKRSEIIPETENTEVDNPEYSHTETPGQQTEV